MYVPGELLLVLLCKENDLSDSVAYNGIYGLLAGLVTVSFDEIRKENKFKIENYYYYYK